MQNAGLEKAQTRIKIRGEISITSDTQMTPHLWQKVKRNKKASWWKWKRRVKKLAWNSTFKIMASGPFISWQIDGETMETVRDFLFLGSKITADGVCSHEIKKCLLLEYDQPRQHIQKQRHYFANKGPSSQGYGFSSSHVWMWELDYKEGWVPKNWCFWTVVLEKTLNRPLKSKEIKPVNPIGNQSWIYIGRIDVASETPILWPPDAKNQLLGKKPWCWERLKAGGEGDDKGWDGWMASLTQ